MLDVSGSLSSCDGQCSRDILRDFGLFESIIAGFVQGRVGVGVGCRCIAITARYRPGASRRTSRLGRGMGRVCPSTGISIFFMSTGHLVSVCGSSDRIAVDLGLTSGPVSLDSGSCITLMGMKAFCGFVDSRGNGLEGNCFRSGIHSCRKRGDIGGYVTRALTSASRRSF